MTPAEQLAGAKAVFTSMEQLPDLLRS
jgi:hypothetical protein